MGRRSRFVLGACLVALAGCGSDDETDTGTTALTQVPSVTTQAQTTAPPTETKPKANTDTEAPDDVDPPAKVEPYRCGGEKLTALSGPRGSKVTVKPLIVEPGNRIEVRVKGAQEARVSIAGVIDEPLVAVAKPDGDDAVAILTMPASAKCGNKLITVEGDLSGQASVGVGTRP